MISETTFARGHSSFWQEYFPWLNNYVDSINKKELKQLFMPLNISEDPIFRSINNIISFNHFKSNKMGVPKKLKKHLKSHYL
jgi:hypothetical protein